MTYLGNTPTTQSFTPQVDYFSGNGVTVTFTLSRPVVSVAQMIVSIDNVIQNPSSAYTVSGSSITFTSAPLSGTNNIWVEYTSLITTYAALSQSPSVVGDITASGGYLAVGNFGNTYTDGVVVDYVTGNARITTGPADGLTIYNGGTNARIPLAKWDVVYNNTALGYQAGYLNTTTNNNVLVGYQAGYSATTDATSQNTFVGYQTGYSNTGGTNAGFGSGALYSNTTGDDNTAIGSYRPLYANTTGTNNIAVGRQALGANTTGSYNTGLGRSALYSNTTASNNTAVGYQAGYSNTTGGGNGGQNTFIGDSAGYSTTSDQNTFVGRAAGYSVTTGRKNTILGGYNGNQGGLDIRTSSNYIVLSDGDGNPSMYCNNSQAWVIESRGNQTSMNFVNYYASYTGNITWIQADRGTTNNTFYALSYYNVGSGTYRFRVADSGNVTNTNNSYGAISDVKLKENIVDATPKLEDLCKVKVRQYNLKSDPDHKQIGVVAQELEEVFAGLVDETKDTDKDGNDLGTTTKQVKYSVFVPMLIKAIQELKAEVDALKAQLEAKNGY